MPDIRHHFRNYLHLFLSHKFRFRFVVGRFFYGAMNSNFQLVTAAFSAAGARCMIARSIVSGSASEQFAHAEGQKKMAKEGLGKPATVEAIERIKAQVAIAARRPQRSAKGSPTADLIDWFNCGTDELASHLLKISTNLRGGVHEDQVTDYQTGEAKWKYFESWNPSNWCNEPHLCGVRKLTSRSHHCRRCGGALCSFHTHTISGWWGPHMTKDQNSKDKRNEAITNWSTNGQANVAAKAYFCTGCAKVVDEDILIAGLARPDQWMGFHDDAVDRLIRVANRRQTNGFRSEEIDACLGQKLSVGSRSAAKVEFVRRAILYSKKLVTYSPQLTTAEFHDASGSIPEKSLDFFFSTPQFTPKTMVKIDTKHIIIYLTYFLHNDKSYLFKSFFQRQEK